MKNKKVLILGGTEDHVSLIKNLRRRGFEVFLLDYLDFPPAKRFVDMHIKESTLNKEIVLETAKNLNVDLVLSMCIDQALLSVGYVSEILGLPCHISHIQARELTNKGLMKKKFSEKNIPTSNFVLINRDEGSREISQLMYPLVVKPLDANSSKGISKVLHESQLENAIKYAFSVSRSDQIIVEEYEEGDEYSVDAVIKDGKPTVILISEIIKIKRNKEFFTISQNIFSLERYLEMKEEVESILSKIAVGFNLKNTPILMQMIKNKKRLSVIECSPRIGGGSKHHFINSLTGFNMINYFLNLILDRDKSIKVNYKYNYGCVNYIYTKPGLIKNFDGFEECLKDRVIGDFFFYRKEGSIIEKSITSSDRVAGYMLLDNNLENLNKKQLMADRKLRILNDVEKDITMHNLHNPVNII